MSQKNPKKRMLNKVLVEDCKKNRMATSDRVRSSKTTPSSRRILPLERPADLIEAFLKKHKNETFMKQHLQKELNLTNSNLKSGLHALIVRKIATKEMNKNNEVWYALNNNPYP